MRIHRLLAVATLVCAGCARPETALRLTIEPGTVPAPASLSVSLAGGFVPSGPYTIAPVTLPGTVVFRGLVDGTSPCVHVGARDADGTLVGEAWAQPTIVGHRTVAATVTLDAPGVQPACVTFGNDDLGAPTGDDLAGVPPGADLATTATPCPPTAIFCDDFESADMAQWTYADSVKVADMGTVARTTTRAAHGAWSLEARASGTSATNNYAVAEKDFPPTMPPLSIRANVWTAQPLSSFTMVMSLYDATTHGFSIGGDDNMTWVIPEDQSAQPDRHSDMVPAGGGAWHCLELVVDASGNVTFFVDGHRLIGPFARASAVAYSTFVVGIDRTVLADTDVFVDDVAVGPSRLYCP